MDNYILPFVVVKKHIIPNMLWCQEKFLIFFSFKNSNHLNFNKLNNLRHLQTPIDLNHARYMRYIKLSVGFTFSLLYHEFEHMYSYFSIFWRGFFQIASHDRFKRFEIQ